MAADQSLQNSSNDIINLLKEHPALVILEADKKVVTKMPSLNADCFISLNLSAKMQTIIAHACQAIWFFVIYRDRPPWNMMVKEKKARLTYINPWLNI